ncbi:hypothetical protein H6G81_06895 [Scytonema hofmannii FACHB-248]|uniref:Uncharacterized protein n=1 Tax=Scytonema hofmannii FACHB-248 TaxID=1842502 RepID=A0ABR8GLI3_9CYAN|nr:MULTISPECIES: hypothetical protein [Nostocales]MBD2604264.1 hypothetical protein [Scytonema hofmannii FACHB-248]
MICIVGDMRSPLFSWNKKKPHTHDIGVWDEFLGDDELTYNRFNPLFLDRAVGR